MEADKHDNENNIVQNGSKEIPEYSTVYTEEALKNVTNGLLDKFQLQLASVKFELKELTTKQNILIEQLHNENLKLTWKQNSEEYQEMFRKIQIYRNKLVTMKSDMKMLHDKSQKLVKRSVRLKNLKEKAEQAKIEQREKELKLIGNK